MINPDEAYLHLPVPQEDGASNHLVGLSAPAVQLPSNQQTMVDLATLTLKPTILYAYPATGTPAGDPAPDWDTIPGAPGCTVESLGFKELYQNFLLHHYQVIGVSTQNLKEQSEFAQRHSIPFLLLSDEKLELTHRLNLPTFEAKGRVFLKRHTLVFDKQQIVKVFYPVFPPHLHAQVVLNWVASE
jgi:peroxiredoxin